MQGGRGLGKPLTKASRGGATSSSAAAIGNLRESSAGDVLQVGPRGAIGWQQGITTGKRKPRDLSPSGRLPKQHRCNDLVFAAQQPVGDDVSAGMPLGQQAGTLHLHLQTAVAAGFFQQPIPSFDSFFPAAKRGYSSRPQ
jgi:hypothetical protein